MKGNKMKIEATVKFGNTEVAHHWEYLDSPSRVLVLLRAEHEGQEDVPLVLKLVGKVRSHKSRSGQAIRENHYNDPLDASEAFFLKTTENTQ